MEMGLTYIKLNEFELANYWFEKAKKDYNGYLLETLLHFRVHCGQRLIKKAKKKQAEIEAALEIEQFKQQQVKTKNEQTGNETNTPNDDAAQVEGNGNLKEEQIEKIEQIEKTQIVDDNLKQIIKLKNKLNDNLKIDDKFIECINEAVEVSSNNL